MAPNYFAEKLTEHRELAGLTRAQVAALAHVSPSTITRWEHGEAAPQRDNVESLDKALDAGGKLRDAWRSVKGRGGLPEWARDLAAIENASRHATLVTAAGVPGMLQAPEYACRIFMAGHPTAADDDLASLVALRCERLAELPDLRAAAVFPATAVGGLSPDLRRAQAKHLLSWVETGRVTLSLTPPGAVMPLPVGPLMIYRLPPDLQQAWRHAVAALDLAAPPDAVLHHGVGGRTLSGPVTTTEGTPVWLRVESAPKPGGRMWEGNRLAEKALPPDVRRPHLLADRTWGRGPVFQALLFSRIDTPSVSASPDLRGPLTVASGWWMDLRTTLHQLQQVSVSESRRSHTPGFIERIPNHLPEVTQAGVDLTVRTWVTSHGDLHWANVTGDPLTLLDWEGWGAAPAGYDAAVLHAYALAQPETAAEVREVFADVLNTDAGRLAHLIICAEIVQAAERDVVHARLAPCARRFAAELLTAR